MASNATSTVCVMNNIASFLLEWVRVGLLPFIVICFNVIIIIAGLGLNIFVMAMFKRWKHYQSAGKYFIFLMALIDTLACLLVLPLSTTATILNSWIFPEVLCTLHCILTRWLYHLTFLLLSACTVDRAILISNRELHQRTFGRGRFVALLSLMVFLSSLGMACVPLMSTTETGGITFDPNIFQCSVLPVSNHLTLHLDLGITIGLPVLVCSVCAVPVFRARRRAVLRKQEFRSRTTPNEADTRSGTLSRESSKPSSFLTQLSTDDVPRETRPKAVYSMSGPVVSGRSMCKRLQTRSRLVVEAMKDDQKDEDYHIAYTYFLAWTLVIMLWSIRLVLACIDVYGSIPIWAGADTIAIMIGSISYCIKPVVYLSHNKTFQRQTRFVFPMVVRFSGNRSNDNVATLSNNRHVFGRTFVREPIAVRTNMCMKGLPGSRRPGERYEYTPSKPMNRYEYTPSELLKNASDIHSAAPFNYVLP